MEISTQFNEQVLEHSPVSMQVLDRDGLTVRVNEAFLRLFNIEKRSDVEGVINLRTHPSIAENQLTESIERAYRGEVVHVQATPFHSGFGPERVIRSVIFPILDEGGSVAQVILIHEDVTELQAKESALERRYEQIAALQHAFHDIGEELTADSVLEHTLSTMERLCMPDAAAVWRQEGGRWTTLAAHGLSERYRQEISDAYLQAPPYWRAPFEEIQRNRAVNIDDTLTDPLTEVIRPILEREGIRRVLAVPMHSGDAVDGAMVFYGKEPGPFDSMDVEVAHLLADQTAIALHNAELLQHARDAEAEARILYQTSSILARSLSLPGVLEALTETVAPLMGLQRVAISLVDQANGETRLVASSGMRAEDLRAWGLDQARRLSDQNELMQRLIATGDPLAMDDVGDEFLRALPDDQHAAVEALNIRSILVVALREDNRTVGTMSFDTPGEARHWTERDVRLARGIATQASAAIRNARLFEEARAARENLEERVRERTVELRAAHDEVVASERLAAIGIMAREVAHGLRNPLNVIATSLYYLKSRFQEPDEKVERHFETISRSVDQSANMINQLMTLAGPRQPEMAPVDLNQIVRRSLQDRFTARDVRWEAEWDEDLPYVSGDWIQLNHAVKALVVNAVASPGTAGADSGPIRVRTGRDGDMAYLEIGDYRGHLTEEARQALFEPFFVSATQWTGLGLSVAKQIASKHNGDVTISEADGMTWFRMTLPFAKTAPDEPQDI